jgi:hypothetical protein
MAYEKRLVRPFEAMDKTQEMMTRLIRVQSPRIPDGFQPPLGSQGDKPLGSDAGAIAKPSGTVILTAEEYQSNSFGLYFGLEDSSWNEFVKAIQEDLNIIFEAVELPISLVVTASNSRLKKIVELLRVPYRALISAPNLWRWDIVQPGNNSSRPIPFQMPVDGCTIDIKFVLDSDLPQRLRAPGRPWRKGTWLAKSSLRVSSGRGSGLLPRSLTPEIRRQFNLGESCSSFVEILNDGEGVCMSSELDELICVYVDPKILDAAGSVDNQGLPANQTGPLIFDKFASEVFHVLVMLFHSDKLIDEFDPVNSECKPTVLFGLLERVASYRGISEEEAFNILKSRPSQFMAMHDGSMELLKTDKALLGIED